MSSRVRTFIAIGCAMLAVMVIGLLPTSTPSDGNLVVPKGTRLRPVGQLSAGRTVIQQCVTEGSDLRSIGVLLATYQRINHGMLRITVSVEADGQWRPVAMATVDETTLKDNAMYTLLLPASAHVVRGARLQIELRSDGPINEAITWWQNPDWKRTGYVLTYNGQILDGTAIIQMSYRPESGRLYGQAETMWQQSTHFLTRFWMGVLFGSLVVTLGSITVLIRRPLGED